MYCLNGRVTSLKRLFSLEIHSGVVNKQAFHLSVKYLEKKPKTNRRTNLERVKNFSFIDMEKTNPDPVEEALSNDEKIESAVGNLARLLNQHPQQIYEKLLEPVVNSKHVMTNTKADLPEPNQSSIKKMRENITNRGPAADDEQMLNKFDNSKSQREKNRLVDKKN